jgi:ERCC4-type nuclease
MIKLLIDAREQKIKTLFETTSLINLPKIDYECLILDLGDFIFKQDDNILLIIERKTINDLYASIKDGRHKEQKARLLSNYPKSKIIYIIEGAIEPIKHDENIIYGAILNTQFRDSLSIVRTLNINETHKYLCFLYKKILNKPEYFPVCGKESNGGGLVPYEQTIKLKKKANMTPNLCQILQLAQIPGISVNISKVILTRYGSLKTLILEFGEHDENMLSEIEIETSTGKKRRIGAVMSSKIHKYLIN